MVNACDVLAIGAHPDDVELGCGGTVARLAAAGRRVAILDLTAGESATRGTPALRRREAAEAAAILGVCWRECLALPDGRLDGGSDDQVVALVGIVRTAAPRAVLIPHPADPHPDHRAAAGLCARAVFLAGLGAFQPELGASARPRLVLRYPGPRQLLVPDLVVECGAEYERKRSALAAHRSQFEPAAGAATHLASGYFLAAVEGRDRAVGNTVGAELGEGLTAGGPLSADDVAWMLGGAR